MKNNPIHVVLILIVLLLLFVVAALRFELFSSSSPPPSVFENSSLCVGVLYPGAPSGLVCVAAKEQIMSAAVENLSIPTKCRDIRLVQPISHGDQIVLSPENCSVVEIRRLPGATRFLVGGGLDINKDSWRDLTFLPRIGQVKARLIVESRQKDGAFEKVEDLQRVKGIGPKTVELIRPWLAPDGSGD